MISTNFKRRRFGLLPVRCVICDKRIWPWTERYLMTCHKIEEDLTATSVAHRRCAHRFTLQTMFRAMGET